MADLFMRNTSKISIVTLAPELEGAMEMVEEFVEKGVVVSMGHSAADLEEGVKAVRRGASFVTHLFNAMLPVSGVVVWWWLWWFVVVVVVVVVVVWWWCGGGVVVVWWWWWWCGGGGGVVVVVVVWW